MVKEIWTGIKRYVRESDWLLLVLSLTLCCFGLLLIFTATYSAGNTLKHIVVQGMGMCIGAVGFVILSLFDFDRFPRLWILLFFFNVMFQLSLAVFGVAGDTGNKSWIPLVAGINIQPGEVGKIIFIYTMACHIDALKDRLNKLSSVLQLGAHAVITMASVYIISRDLGVALMYPLIFLMMLFASGISLWWVGGVCAAGAAAVPVLWKIMSDYQKLRIIVVWNPEASERFAWHGKLSMRAVGNGQLTGKGFLKGTMIQSDAYPAQHTDFIFSTCAEEFGFIGCMILLLLLTALVFHIFIDAARCSSRIGSLVCVGVGSMLMWQILINVGMCLGIMPVIGLTLPLVSYGGTSVMTTLASFGIVCGYVMRKKPNWLR